MFIHHESSFDNKPDTGRIIEIKDLYGIFESTWPIMETIAQLNDGDDDGDDDDNE